MYFPEKSVPIGEALVPGEAGPGRTSAELEECKASRKQERS